MEEKRENPLKNSGSQYLVQNTLSLSNSGCKLIVIPGCARCTCFRVTADTWKDSITCNHFLFV